MADISLIATSLANNGRVVRNDFSIWDGVIQPKLEWGMTEIDLMPPDMKRAVFKVKSNILAIIKKISIPCRFGFFIKTSMLPQWSKSHYDGVEMFRAIRTSVAASLPYFRELAKSTAFTYATEQWSKTHQGESIPPSVANHASNVAMSMVPTSDKFYELFNVVTSVMGHPFIESQSSPFISERDKSFLAWSTVDDLVAKNFRILRQGIEHGISVEGNQRKFDAIRRHSERFVSTDLLPSLGISSRVGRLLQQIEGKKACELDLKTLCLDASAVFDEARPFTTVSGVMEAIK